MSHVYKAYSELQMCLITIEKKRHYAMIVPYLIDLQKEEVPMKRTQELDLARVIAMFSVIVIHVTSTYINSESNFMILGMNLAFILNQVTRFAVPLFILLSGVSLALSSGNDDFAGFIKHRALKIGVPYLVWTSIYYLYNHFENLSPITLRSALRAFLLGQAAPHLYFIVIIFQFYLLYPLLKKWVSKAPYQSVMLSFIISYGIQKLFFFRKFGLDLIPAWIRPYLWLLFPTWMFYFIVGLALTKERLVAIQKFTAENSAAILVITAVFSALYIIDSNITGALDSIKSSLNFFVLLVFLFAFALWKYIGKFCAVQKTVSFLAKHSMTIYFEHVLVLYYLRRLAIFTHGTAGMLLLLVLDFVIAFLVAYLLGKVSGLLQKATH